LHQVLGFEFGRRAVGLASSMKVRSRLQASLAIMALTARRPAPDSLIHHSDRGVSAPIAEAMPHPRSFLRHLLKPRMCRYRDGSDSRSRSRREGLP